jgi:hypothetical protein
VGKVTLVDAHEYLTRRRRFIFWDEHLWYVHLLVLWLVKDHVTYGLYGFLGVLLYGGACMAYSYVSFWKLEDAVLARDLPELFGGKIVRLPPTETRAA